MAQYLKFTSDLLVDALWAIRSSCTVTDTGDASPGGGKWATIDTTAVSSWLNQDRKDGVGTLGGSKRLQASVRVRANVGDQADLVVSLYENTNTLSGEIRLLADLTAGTVSITQDTQGQLAQDTDESDSVYIVDEGDGVFRVGFSFISTADTDRIIFKLHTTSSFNSADYTDANLIDSTGDGLEPFVYFETAPKLTPTRFQTPFASPLNPDPYAEVPEIADVWHDKIEDITFDSVVQVATPDELSAAITTACASPALKHKVEITTDDWNGLLVTGQDDVRISQSADFLASSGCLFITTQSGNQLVSDQRWQITGLIRGLALYNVKSTYFNDQYLDPDGKGDLNYTALWYGGGNAILDNCTFGNGDQLGHDMMYSATSISLNSEDEVDSMVIRNFMSRGALNDIKASGPIRVVTENHYYDQQFQDSCYARMNSGSVPENSTTVWVKKDITNGPVASRNLYLVCCNTRQTDWTLPGEVYPYEVGQVVQQESGFQGKVIEIYEGNGIDIAPHVHNCRNVAGDGGYGWEGDLVFIESTDSSYKYMVEDEPLVSATASYIPTFLNTNGAPQGMDGGLVLGFLHSDGHQYGTIGDQPYSTYKIFTMGWFSVMSGPNAGAVQHFITNKNDTCRQLHYTDTCYINGTATRGHPIEHTDTVLRNAIITLAPLGNNAQRSLADPAVSFPGESGITQINVSTYLDRLDRGDYDHDIDNVISKSNTNPGYVGFDYPWLSRVTVADPYAEDDTSYDVVFGRTRARSPIDNAVVELEPIVPHNGTLEQCKAVIANWIDWYRTPVVFGGWDLTVAQTGSKLPHPLIYGRDHNPGNVPVIQFTDWPHQVIEANGSWTVPTFTATDGVTDLTSSVVVTESVDTSVLGYQWVQYDVTNSDGNTCRTFSVVEVIEPIVQAGTVTKGEGLLVNLTVRKNDTELLSVAVDDPDGLVGVSVINGNSNDWVQYKKTVEKWVSTDNPDDTVLIDF